MNGFDAVPTDGPADFLERAGPWLRLREDHHNLLLGLVESRTSRRSWPDGECFAVVERAGEVVGCVARTPPFKAILTDLPTGAGPAVAVLLDGRYDDLPALFGPRAAAEGVAAAWVGLRGGGFRTGMPQGLYRIDRVRPPTGVPGRMRRARPAEIETLVSWGEGFGRDTGIPFPSGREPVERWLEQGVAYVWDSDAVPVSLAVAHGRTQRGARVGYVYTPPELRGRGYAGALVASLSQSLLDGGCDFCVLYTDLTNATSNALYRRIGYRRIAELVDVHLVAAE